MADFLTNKRKIVGFYLIVFGIVLIFNLLNSLKYFDALLILFLVFNLHMLILSIIKKRYRLILTFMLIISFIIFVFLVKYFLINYFTIVKSIPVLTTIIGLVMVIYVKIFDKHNVKLYVPGIFIFVISFVLFFYFIYGFTNFIYFLHYMIPVMLIVLGIILFTYDKKNK